jgi:type II secretory pathway component PulK
MNGPTGRTHAALPEPGSGCARPGREGERGIALLIVIAVVAMLMIVVTEFTYNVQIDQHRVRNSLHALQAELMVRSGVNLAEGFLGLDEETDVDTYSDEWWFLLNQFCDGITLGDGSFATKLKCTVLDEGGKINVNLTRDRRGHRPPPGEFTTTTLLRDALRCIFQRQEGLDVGIIDDLAEYWQREPAQLEDGSERNVPIFRSLEDFAATFGISTKHIEVLRRYLTAYPRSRLPGININTASPEVLSAILNPDPESLCGSIPEVDDILARQLDPENPIRRADVRSLMPPDDNVQVRTSLFVARSNIYRLEASAITNFDAESEESSGGIGKTLSVVVYRRCPPGQNQGGKCLHWTFKPLDWQKESGARLFREPNRFAELSEYYDDIDPADVSEYFGD